MTTLDELHQTCRRLLEEGTVKVVIGYAQSAPDEPAFPVFIGDAADVEQLVWNEWCLANLTKYLLRKDIQALGKPAIIVKGCDARTLLVLERESQIDRGQMAVIGMACPGMGQPQQAACAACEVRQPQFCDIVIGEESAGAATREKGAAEKGTGPICAQHPPGRSGKLDLSPFPRPLIPRTGR